MILLILLMYILIGFWFFILIYGSVFERLYNTFENDGWTRLFFQSLKIFVIEVITWPKIFWRLK